VTLLDDYHCGLKRTFPYFSFLSRTLD